MPKVTRVQCDVHLASTVCTFTDFFRGCLYGDKLTLLRRSQSMAVFCFRFTMLLMKSLNDSDDDML